MARARGKPFEKGKSGNPNGRPKISKEVTELAEQESAQAFRRIVAISKESKDLRLKLSANQYIVDRAAGKPVSQVNVGDHKGGPLTVNLIVRTKTKGNLGAAD